MSDAVPTPPEGEKLEDALDWSRYETEVGEPIVRSDDDANHHLAGILGAAQTIGLRGVLWDAMAAHNPRFASTFDSLSADNVPEEGSLEYARLSDLVIDMVPFAEDWLREWLTSHGVPYLTATVMCPSHGVMMFMIAGDVEALKRDFGADAREGLNDIYRV